MKKILSILAAILISGLSVLAQPLVPAEFQRSVRHRAHHTDRLPGVNERRLLRLEKMRMANNARRHRQGPFRAKEVEYERGLVLLVQFSDLKMQRNAVANWTDRFNKEGFSLDNHVGSVRDYFLDQSYGQLSIDFDVVGPLTLSKTQEYYASAPNSNLSDRAAEMVIEALKQADSQVNFANYDWDGDGEVDQVYVIYAGTADYEGTTIWPHEWSLEAAKFYDNGSGTQRMDGVTIDTYAVSNELIDSKLAGIGTACHEFSHCLGFPDFYDTYYNGGTGGQYWDLLDGGEYNGPNGDGEQPCPYTAYERWCAGWIDLIPLTEPCRIKDMPCINEEGVGYVITNSGNVNEYYILENRQQRTFGKGNNGHGLMVWHIDYSAGAWKNNQVNVVKDHQRMTFLPADGRVGEFDEVSSLYFVSKADEAGDPYPGSKKVTSVEQLTWFMSEKGGTKKHANLIHDISESADGKISFTYGDWLPLEKPEVMEPTEMSADGFRANWQAVDGAETYNIEFLAQSNEAALRSILTEDFSGLATASRDTQVGSSVINKYTQVPGWVPSYCYGTGESAIRIASNKNTGSLTTPDLDNQDGELVISFDAAYYNTDNSSAEVTVLVGSTKLATKSVQLTSQREEYTLTFEDIPAGAKVQFASTAKSKRFYLYNISISDMSGTQGTIISYKGITEHSYFFSPIEAESYLYRVQAVGKDGFSEWSDWMKADTSDGIMLPYASSTGQAIYDLAGRRLTSLPKQGLFIKGGRKYIVR